MDETGKDIVTQEDLELRAQHRAAYAAKVDARVQLVRKRATNAVRRLLKARPKTLPRPKTPQDLVDLVDYMAKSPRLFGVCLTKPEIRAIEMYHALWRQANQAQQPDHPTPDAPADLVPADLWGTAPASDRLGDGSGA